MTDPAQIYFAGDLFNHKDLAGNFLLADSIESQSEGRLRCILPQHLEQTTGRSVDIRNNDLLQILKADLILCNFDGLELDSGTVIEFFFAKMLDLPAVLLRSDFRAAGDQHRDGDPWNLMCSGYPRTRVLKINSMESYQLAWNAGGSTTEVLNRFYQGLGEAVFHEFEKVMKEPSILSANVDEVGYLYRWAKSFPGSKMGELLADEELQLLVSRKLRKKG